jgi:hypothetical protein
MMSETRAHLGPEPRLESFGVWREDLLRERRLWKKHDAISEGKEDHQSRREIRTKERDSRGKTEAVSAGKAEEALKRRFGAGRKISKKTTTNRQTGKRE